MLKTAGQYVEGLDNPVRLLVLAEGVHITAYAVPTDKKVQRIVTWKEIGAAQFDVVTEAVKLAVASL
jgi:hypothetical protein